jgi:hypothetical protein
MEVGIVAGLIALLGVVSIYFWVVRRPEQEKGAEPSQR